MVFHRRRLLIGSVQPHFVAAAGGSPATFDNSVNFQILLSGSFLVATNSVGPGQFGDVRGTTSKSTGKFYIEWTMSGSGGVFIGLCNATQSFASGFFPGAVANALCLNSTSSGGAAGDINLNGTTLRYTSVAFANGDVDGLAVDVGAGKIWARRNAGNWNDDVIGNQNPATGTGGFNIAGLGTPIYFMGYVETNASTGTVNTGGSAYANSAPSGFGSWT